MKRVQHYLECLAQDQEVLHLFYQQQVLYLKTDQGTVSCEHIQPLEAKALHYYMTLPDISTVNNMHFTTISRESAIYNLCIHLIQLRLAFPRQNLKPLNLPNPVLYIFKSPHLLIPL